MKLLFRIYVRLLMCIILALFSACRPDGLVSVTREDLFTLDIGLLEDQIDLYNLEGGRNSRTTSLAVRDGLFYIADGNGGKVVHYTSYGDLLFMIYNEETNPPPLTLRTDVEAGGIITRRAFSYPLQEPGTIAVDARKHIYVEDRLPYERRRFNTENRILEDSIVLHFDPSGSFMGYLGKEGIGGSPFPNIERISVSVRDEYAVVCRMPTGWTIYWYDAEGTLLYLLPLKNENIPIPPDRQPVFPSIDTIAVSPDSRKVFVKVDYYRETFDESTNTRLGTEPDSSVIWLLNMEDGSYEGTLEVPFFEQRIIDPRAVENTRRTTERLFYSLLGVVKNDQVFLIFPVEGGYSIMILSTDGHQQRRGFIQVQNEELQYNTFTISAEGILSALLATDFQARLVWWRTDKFLEEGGAP
ncbi:lipoprotein [Spirochaetia bacterium]|nr:lipoprotein [Spirochaetia bacterium]